jgi:glycosyltransferase involved in cell wall biosynthesis
MKRFAIFLFLAFAAFAGSFAFARVYDLKGRTKIPQIASKPFEPASFALVNRPFAIVIVGANNGASVEKTIASIYSQNYENYRVIYIDDASDDGSFDVARDLIYANDKLAQVTLVHNDQRLGVLANVSRAVKTCREEEIVVVLQGEDWLAHEWVLQRLNAYYADPDLWLAYGQAMDFPTYQLTPSQDFKDHKFRLQPSIGSHLKSFYAGLFQRIRESDFVYAGTYLPACSDLAYMIPML